MIKILCGLFFLSFCQGACISNGKYEKERVQLEDPICYVELPRGGEQYVFSIYAFFSDGFGYKLTRLPKVDDHEADYFLSMQKDKHLYTVVDDRSLVLERVETPMSFMFSFFRALHLLVPSVKIVSVSWPRHLTAQSVHYQIIHNADLMQLFWLCRYYGQDLQPGKSIRDESCVTHSFNVKNSSFLKDAKWLALTITLYGFLVDGFSLELVQDRQVVETFANYQSINFPTLKECFILSSKDKEHYVFYQNGTMAHLKASFGVQSPAYYPVHSQFFSYAGFDGEWESYRVNDGTLSITFAKKMLTCSIEALDAQEEVVWLFSNGTICTESRDKDLLAAFTVLPARRTILREKKDSLSRLEQDMAWWTRGALLHQEFFPPESPIHGIFRLRQYQKEHADLEGKQDCYQRATCPGV